MRLTERSGTAPAPTDGFTAADLADMGVTTLTRGQLNDRGIQVLNGIMGYRNERVIQRYLEDNGGTYKEAEEVYYAMLQYLAVCALTRGKRTPSKVIDEMWHCFILHMKDYEQFCKTHLRQMVYHDPASDDNGFKFYSVARDCAISLFGEVSELAWPKDHKRYDRCISCSPAMQDLFADCRKVA